ncbi:MAG: DEAD/DEAH box helicase [Myxococcota bacterium]
MASRPRQQHPAAAEFRTGNQPIRLAYELSVAGRISGVLLLPRTAPGGRRLAESDLKELLPRLHDLDQAIVRELRSGLVFGQLGDAGLARLFPLLAQRHTTLDGKELRLEEEPLRPRIRIRPGAAGRIHILLGLVGEETPWSPVGGGRLIAGDQAFFLRGSAVYPVESPAPWELGVWSKSAMLDLGSDITPLERDRLVRHFTTAGVPEEDLIALAVRRGPPDATIVHLLSDLADTQPVARLRVSLVYAGEVSALAGTQTKEIYIVPRNGSTVGIIERDLAMEAQTRQELRRLGFRLDRDPDLFVARGEAAIRALDPAAGFFPDDWTVERDAEAPLFRRDLEIRASVRLDQERGLLDLSVGVEAVGDDETVAALIDMKELLAWLKSNQKYVRLGDGTYVAPSRKFRQSLRVLADLGADQGRVLVSPLCAGLLRALSDADGLAISTRATAAWLDEISGTSEPESVEPPASLVSVLRDYQCRGLDWLSMLHRHRLTGILADDMGLGKTVQTLALLLRTRDKEGAKPSLVVAPTSVVTVWRDEAARFTPELRLALWHGAPSVRHAIDVTAYDVLVTSYGILRRDADKLAKIAFRYVILDEAQSAKNAASQNARAIRHLKSERRLALTGTPIENRPEELWATFDFLAPGFLGTLRQFRKRYARPISQGDESALGLLRARIQPLVLRRMKTEVARELPAKVESTMRSEMLPAQRALYDHVAGELRESVQNKIEKIGIGKAHLHILAALTRLRQICCDPALLPTPKGVKVPGSAKLALFEELMREALASERRVVVFSQFVKMQKRLIAVIRKLGVEPLWLHGGTRRRDKVVDAFQTPSGPPVIVVSLRAGGTGLTLTRADTVMHYDPWWNPAVERQASDRVHRLGQTHQVAVYKLVCARSIEERVVSMAAAKDTLAEQLLGSEGGAQPKQITSAEVLALLQ